MAVLLQILGILVTLANGVWLAARLLAPHDMTKAAAIRVFLPAAIIGLVLAWVGRRLGQRELNTLTKK